LICFPLPLAPPPRAPPRAPTPVLHQPLSLISPLSPLPLAPATVAADLRRQKVFGGAVAAAGALGRCRYGSWRRWSGRRPRPGGGGRPWILVPAEIHRCCGFWPYGDAVGGLCGADLRNSVELHPATSREVQLPVKTELRLRSWRRKAVYTHRHLVEGIVQADFIFSLWLF
jgi:hypothetical protein